MHRQSYAIVCSMTENITAKQYAALSRQVVQLYEYMERIKTEIASVKHPDVEDDHFHKVADQLNAIVKATEVATNSIMEAAEASSKIAEKLKGDISAAEKATCLDQIVANSNQVFEACTFQDITGQRISKIVTTMNLLEGALSSLVVIIGKEGIAALPVHRSKPSANGEAPLDGPALDGDERVSQADIDAMFD